MIRCDGDPLGSGRGLPAEIAELPTRGDIAAGLADGRSLPLVQQEGTFWTRSLWSDSGAMLRRDLRLAGDFELWTRLARHAEQVTLLQPLAYYRRRPGQLSGDMAAYLAEVDQVQGELATAAQGATRDAGPSPLLAEVTHPNGTWRFVRRTPLARPSGDRAGQLTRWGQGRHAAHAEHRVTPRGEAQAAGGVTHRLATGQFGWEVTGHRPEGPFPDLGLHERFVWLTGNATTLRLTLPHPGRYALHLRLANHHPDQRLHVSGPGVDLNVRAPVSCVPQLMGTRGPSEAGFRAQWGRFGG